MPRKALGGDAIPAVFTAGCYPLHWIMADPAGRLWIVPAAVDGWRRRRRWQAGGAGLEPVPRAEARRARMTVGAMDWAAGAAQIRAELGERAA